jgi:hypothetical protein
MSSSSHSLCNEVKHNFCRLPRAFFCVFGPASVSCFVSNLAQTLWHSVMNDRGRCGFGNIVHSVFPGTFVDAFTNFSTLWPITCICSTIHFSFESLHPFVNFRLLRTVNAKLNCHSSMNSASLHVLWQQKFDRAFCHLSSRVRCATLLSLRKIH